MLVSSLSLIRYRGNDYSVPTQYGHRQAWVKGYVHEVAIACGSEVIAQHERSYEREIVVFDPLHYLALLEQKMRALDQAAPLAGWQLPECFAQLPRLLEAWMDKHGSREYVQVLRLMETFDLLEVTPPHLPLAQVHATQAADYMTLLLPRQASLANATNAARPRPCIRLQISRSTKRLHDLRRLSIAQAVLWRPKLMVNREIIWLKLNRLG